MKFIEEQGHAIVQHTTTKISKVKFLLDANDNATSFVSGSWNASSNSVTLWNTNQEPSAKSSGIQKKYQLNVNADVNDIATISQTQFVVGLSNGDINVVSCDSEDKLSKTQTYFAVHNKAASTAVCVVNNEIFSGSDTGTIVRISPTRKTKAISTLSTDLMGVNALTCCTEFQLVSAHTTGQMHLWDTRLSGKSAIAILGRIPAVTTLNDSLTSIGSHPAQPNVIAFGTNSGSVSFIDIRRPDQDLPNLFKICQEAVNLVIFHPVYTKNFFSSSDSGLIHWDASSMLDQPEERDDEDAVDNIWLSGKMWNSIQLKALAEDDPKLISTFDVSQDSIIIGSNTATLMLLNNINFF
ncbi:nucleoporin Nup43 [Ditylenchus destructor]|uniref:Nucleoporin Nup43 n=1 Tax=Ditylenchus destructor TaxID=166010 RepID=A0AAD4RC64_9BILA|nr:nucleoporin Nup43 [Ditylenchus destructor]